MALHLLAFGVSFLAGVSASPAPKTLGSILPRQKPGISLKYRFTCDYANFAPKGNVLSHRKFGGDVEMLPDGRIVWQDLKLETSGPTGAYKREQLKGLEHGFSYHRKDVVHQLEPSFFKPLPAMPIEVRNFIWDTHMFEQFVRSNVRRRHLNEVARDEKEHKDALAGIGTFTTATSDITWLAVTTMNDRPCALLRYRSFYNRLHVEQQGLNIDGNSQFGGEIWVSLKDGAIEKATIYEEVVAEGGKLGVFPTFRVGELTRVR